MLRAPPRNLSGVEPEDLPGGKIETRFTSERHSFRLKMGLSGAVDFLTCCHRLGHAGACRKPGLHDVAEDLGTSQVGRWEVEGGREVEGGGGRLERAGGSPGPKVGNRKSHLCKFFPNEKLMGSNRSCIFYVPASVLQEL